MDSATWGAQLAHVFGRFDPSLINESKTVIPYIWLGQARSQEMGDVIVSIHEENMSESGLHYKVFEKQQSKLQERLGFGNHGHAARVAVARPKARQFGPAQARHNPLPFHALATPKHIAGRAWTATSAW